jgi:putative spermidine/putrescine transport system substrate-binding protein
MDRRSFMGGMAALLAAGLSGCQGKGPEALKIRLLKGSIPAPLPNAFLKQAAKGVALDVAPAEQIAELFGLLQGLARLADPKAKAPTGNLISQLQFWKSPQQRSGQVVVPDLVTIGDAWLAVAIRQGLLQPLEVGAAWDHLDERFRQLVRRDGQGALVNQGSVWGAPYRWGGTVIAYRKDILKEKGIAPPKDWEDLWRSEFRSRLALPDQPREVIGLVLKSLGQSYNPTALDQPELKTKLTQLHQQASFYSNDNYLQPLVLGDTWVAVGSSIDLLRQARTMEAIEVVFPSSGTALWADLWVRPKSAVAAKSALVNQWVEFCWSEAVVGQLSSSTQAASPMLRQTKATALTQDLRENPVLYPSDPAWDKSEFLQPLPESVMGQFSSLWETLRPPVSR